MGRKGSQEPLAKALSLDSKAKQVQGQHDLGKLFKLFHADCILADNYDLQSRLGKMSSEWTDLDLRPQSKQAQ